LVYNNLNDFYNDGDINNPENIVINHNINQKRSIKFVNEEIWKMFKSLYGGGPEISTTVFEEKIKNSNQTKTLVEIYQGIFKICLIPKFSDLDENSIKNLKYKNIFISNRKYISDLKNKLYKILIKLNIYGTNKLSLDNLRLWKLNSNFNFGDFQNLLSKIYKNNKTKIEIDAVTYLECKIFFYFSLLKFRRRHKIRTFTNCRY